MKKEVSYGWWESFRKRHPKLCLRTASVVSKSRAIASNREVVDRYFDLLEETLNENDLRDKPGQIFNLDETGMPLDPKPPKTVHVRGDHNPYLVRGTGQKSQVSILACVSAAGQCIPPMVIWDRRSLKPELVEGEVPGTVHALTKKGWMNQEVFEGWFSRHFIRYAPPARPLLVLMDGHSSHYSPTAVRMAAEEGVILFALPPNTTHFAQPLDKSVFGPLKVHWRRVCQHFMSKNLGQTVNRYVFIRLFAEAWFGAMTAKNIITGFRITGIFPVDRNAITLPGEKRKSLAERTGLSYIPFMSPTKKTKVKFSVNDIDNYKFSEESIPRYSQRDGLQLLDVTSSSDDDDGTNAYQPVVMRSALSQFVRVPSPPHKKVAIDNSRCGAVLTSSENLKLIEEKKKEKESKLSKKKSMSKIPVKSDSGKMVSLKTNML